MSTTSFPRRDGFLFSSDGTSLVTPEVYALESAHDLLSAALRYDESRHWWQLPDRLWVGRAQSALAIIEMALPPARQGAVLGGDGNKSLRANQRAVAPKSGVEGAS